MSLPFPLSFFSSTLLQLLRFSFQQNFSAKHQVARLRDVCVDALALEILRPSELGAGNTIQHVVGLHSPLLYCHLSCPTGTVAQEPHQREAGLLGGGEDQPECGGEGPEGRGGSPRHQQHAHLCSLLQVGRAWRKLDTSLLGGQAGVRSKPWRLDWRSSLLCFSSWLYPCWLPHVRQWSLPLLAFEVERLGEMSACPLA